MLWEYSFVEGHLSNLPDFVATLNDFGAQGWEVVQMTFVHQQVGQLRTNAIATFLRRQFIPLGDLPDGTPEGWYEDPKAEKAQRHWDGATWTHNVACEGVMSIDPPRLVGLELLHDIARINQTRSEGAKIQARGAELPPA